ncbi:universal stress protein [Zobellella maritima]|uniref:universal stress protein n=1 Tax=Zobellella maritima TaxID=2059725 RepID=UPI000E30A4E2|nr:universal stress protein [Zobellella maritima]
MPYRNILLALELSEREKPLLKRAVELAEHCQARLHLVHVDPEMSGIFVGSLNMDLRQLKMKLKLESGREIMNMLRVEQRRVESISLPTGDIQRAIRLAAREKDADLLICGHHAGHSFLGHLFSNAARFIDIGGCDVLVVKL